MKLIGRIGPQSSVNTDHLIVYASTRAVFRKGMRLTFGVTDDGKMMRAGYAYLRDVIGFDQLSLLLEQPANVCVPAIAPGDFIYDDEPKSERPTYNHSRADGPFMPCPQCLRRMPRKDLIALAEDLMETIADKERGT
jgi:hypothetical protein